MINGMMQMAAVLPSAAPALAKMLTGEVKALKPKVGKTSRRVSTIWIDGILTPDFQAFIRRELLTAMNNDDIKTVVLQMNSPGGFVQGTTETSEIVRRVAKQKNVVVIAEGHLCSAAFSVASGARKIIASPSTIVGSCGVISVMVDDSAAFAAEGIRVIPITTGPAKTLGLPGVPVTEQDIERVVRHITESKTRFNRDLRLANRMTAQQREEAFDTAETYHAAEAMKHGFIDEVALVEDAIESIFNSAPITHEHLRGQEALEMYESILCNTSKVEFTEEASEYATKKIAKDFPELTAAALQHERYQRI